MSGYVTGDMATTRSGCDACRYCDRLGCNGHEDVAGPSPKYWRAAPEPLDMAGPEYEPWPKLPRKVTQEYVDWLGEVGASDDLVAWAQLIVDHDARPESPPGRLAGYVVLAALFVAVVVVWLVTRP